MPTYNENLARLIDPSTSKVPFAKLATPLTQSDLSDISVGSGTSGQTIKWNGSAWTNADAPTVDTASFATETYINTKVTDLVNGAPAALNTLSEFATAIDNNANLAGQIDTHIGNGKMKCFVADGSADTFELIHMVGNVDVWLNGVKLNPHVTSNHNQTYADSWISSNDGDQAFKSGTQASGTPMFTRYDLSSGMNPDSSGDTLNLYFDMDIATGNTTFNDIWTSDPANYGTIYFKSGSAIGDPVEPGGWGNQDGTYQYINARAGVEDPMTTKVSFTPQNADLGNSNMDAWFGNYAYGHYNTALEIAFYGPGQGPSGGAFTPVTTLNNVGTHIKLEVVPDSGDIVIVRAY